MVDPDQPVPSAPDFGIYWYLLIWYLRTALGERTGSARDWMWCVVCQSGGGEARCYVSGPVSVTSDIEFPMNPCASFSHALRSCRRETNVCHSDTTREYFPLFHPRASLNNFQPHILILELPLMSYLPDYFPPHGKTCQGVRCRAADGWP